MDEICLTLWFLEKPTDVDSLYESFKNLSFFNPNEFYVNADESVKEKRIIKEEIELLFKKYYKLEPPLCISLGNRNFRIDITIPIQNNDCVFKFSNFECCVKMNLFRNNEDYFELEKFFKQMILLFKAKYGIVDSISNSSRVMRESNEDIYVPEKYVQNLFWGNFFGKGYVHNQHLMKVINNHFIISEKVGDGYFVKLSDYVSGFSSEEVNYKRRKLRKDVKSITGYHYIRYDDNHNINQEGGSSNAGDGTVC